MKNLMIFGLFIICLVAAQFSYAQSADEIVDKYVAALGGKQKMLDLKTVKMIGSLSVQGIDVTLTINRKHMVGARTDISVMGTENFQLITPEKSWSYMPVEGQSSPQEVSEEEHKSTVGTLDLQGILVNYKEKGHAVEYKGKETVGGIDCYKLAITTKNGKALTYYIDTKTDRLTKTMSKTLRNGEETDLETTFSDYRQTKEGYWFAFSMTSPRGEIIYSSIEANGVIDDSLFKAN